MSVHAYLAANPVAFTITCAFLGLIVGSFLNVVVHRLPRMLERQDREACQALLEVTPDAPAERYDLVVPRSRCPHCGHAIRAHENIPVLSYLILGGRCSSCAASISIRYPIVELLSAIAAAAVAWRFGFGLRAGGALLLTWALIALSFIDFDTQLLPDDITLPLLWLGLLFNLPGVFTTLSDAVVGAVAGYGLLWAVYHVFRLLTGKEGMGYGDFKLLAALGAWLGWQALPSIILLSSVAGAIVGLSLIALRGHGRDVPIPFGPYLAMGGWLALMWGAQINSAYLRAAGLAP